MDYRFKNILIPVDFSINTEIAVKKALELVNNEDDACIHLVHVLAAGMPVLPGFTPSSEHAFTTSAGESAEKKLRSWQRALMESMPKLAVKIHLFKGKSVQFQVTRLAKVLKPELVIIGKHNYHNWLTFLNAIDTDKLATLTHCPVLTVKTGSLHNKVRSIVFPVKCFVPNRKIDLLISLAKKYRAKVLLVIHVNPVDETPTPLYGAFIETYRLLKSSLTTPIEHRVVAGTNLAKAALDFAQSVDADMILLTPESETKISLLTGRQVSDVIRGDSKLEVLSVDPLVDAG